MARRDKINLDEYIEEALDNIRNDREITTSLLKDVMVYLSVDDDRHERVGPVAAKYVETLQRSNEQLVKLASLVQKKTTSSNMTSADREEIFDLIQTQSKETA